MLFNVNLCMHIIQLRTGGGTWGTVLHTVRGVGGLGIRMLTFDTKTVVHRGSGAPSTDPTYIPHTHKIVGTQFCVPLSHPSFRVTPLLGRST